MSDPGCFGSSQPAGFLHSSLPLHVAMRRGAPSVVKLLIEAGSSLDTQAVHGQTLFLVACQVSGMKQNNLI